MEPFSAVLIFQSGSDIPKTNGPRCMKASRGPTSSL